MAEPEDFVFEKYIITMRAIQPARIQDVLRFYSEIWSDELDDSLRQLIKRFHAEMKASGKLVTVRRGTYVLRREGMQLAASLAQKERLIDNVRLFLMKRQRRSYRKSARRFG